MQNQMYCHNISAQNYFNSPKMPIKDHIVGLRSTMSSFKRTQNLLDNKTMAVLGNIDMNKTQNMSQSILKLKQMDLMKPKALHLVKHKSQQDKGLNSNIHTRQTNPGYSRNMMGGFYTK